MDSEDSWKPLDKDEEVERLKVNKRMKYLAISSWLLEVV